MAKKITGYFVKIFYNGRTDGGRDGGDGGPTSLQEPPKFTISKKGEKYFCRTFRSLVLCITYYWPLWSNLFY